MKIQKYLYFKFSQSLQTIIWNNGALTYLIRVYPQSFKSTQQNTLVYTILDKEDIMLVGICL